MVYPLPFKHNKCNRDNTGKKTGASRTSGFFLFSFFIRFPLHWWKNCLVVGVWLAEISFASVEWMIQSCTGENWGGKLHKWVLHFWSIDDVPCWSWLFRVWTLFWDFGMLLLFGFVFIGVSGRKRRYFALLNRLPACGHRRCTVWQILILTLISKTWRQGTSSQQNRLDVRGKSNKKEGST